MRHRVYGKHLGRNKDERRNLFKGLLRLLLTHGTIQTSETKAKAIKGLVDKIINLAKDKKEARLQSFLTDKNLRDRLIKEIVPLLGGRTSGYTSMVRMGTRLGDQTTMVRMSLIGAEELKSLEKKSSSENQELSKKSEKPKKKTIATTPRKSIKVKTVKTKKGAKKLNS